MKKIFAVAIAMLMILVCLSACAEKISCLGLTVDTTATEIDFAGYKVNGHIPELVEFLDQLPNLEKADMYNSVIDEEDMEMLFNRYPNVFFGWTLYVGDHKVRTDVTAWSTLHSSKSEPHREGCFKKLKYCKNLIALDMGHNLIRDCSFLNELPNLKVLIVGRNEIKDITPIGNMKNLEYLEMFSNGVTDLSPLANCTNLIDLCITNTRVTDLTPLDNCTKIQRFWCGMNKKLPKEQVEHFVQTHPGCEVDSYSHPTGGTWREHPRYFVIKHMFGGTDYIPFDL